MAFEVTFIDRTGWFTPLKGGETGLTSEGPVPDPDHAATCFAFPQHLCAAASEITTPSFDHACFDDTKTAKTIGGADRLEEGKRQDTHTGGSDHACAGHVVGASDIISSSQAVPARHLQACGRSACALDQTDTAFDGLMTSCCQRGS